MNRNVSHSDSSELLFSNSPRSSDGIGLTDTLISASDDLPREVLPTEKPSSENNTIVYPLNIKNVKMKSYCDSREVSARAKCRCSSPRRWNKTEQEQHAANVNTNITPCCILNAKNKPDEPSENCEIERLSNEIAENLKISTDSNHTALNGTCTCHLDSMKDHHCLHKSCENVFDYVSLNGVSKIAHTGRNTLSNPGCDRSTCRSGVFTFSEGSEKVVNSVCNGTDSDSPSSVGTYGSRTRTCTHEDNSSGYDCHHLEQIEYQTDGLRGKSKIVYIGYGSECQMPDIMRLIQKDLSEPYSIYTYRYFIHNWPHLCFLALDDETCVGAIVCKLDMNKNVVRRGYIAMLAVDEKYREQKIGSNLVLKAIQAMIADDADEVVLETEITNKPALRLYENLGFVRDKRLFRYYLNGVDALRLKLWLR